MNERSVSVNGISIYSLTNPNLRSFCLSLYVRAGSIFEDLSNNGISHLFEHVVFRNIKNKYEGWVLPKGTVEAGETHEETALREVLEESGSKAYIVDYIGRSEYTFTVPEDVVEKEVHWYLMGTDSYYSKPQREEYFADSGFYKYHEAYHLLKFANEKQILEKAYADYQERKRNNQWKN